MNQEFQIGEKVISLSNNKGKFSQPRKKGAMYTITQKMYCNITGIQLVNIDSTPNQGGSNRIKCTCGNTHGAWGLAWTLSDQFIRPENLDERLAQAVEEEDYETAATLRDVGEKLIQNLDNEE